MSHIGRGDAEALATFVRRLRPPAGQPGHWNQAGTVDAIQKCKAPLSETAVALIRLAEDTTVRTPALLNQDGHWWHRAARGEVPSEAAVRYRQILCPEHRQPQPCPGCDAERGPELTPEQIAEEKARCLRLADEARQKARAERADLTTRQEKP